MRGFNKAIIAGTLGQDPDVRHTPQGNAVATLSLATNEKYKDKTGNTVEETEWHRVVMFGKMVELTQYLKKGSKVLVTGKIKTRKWQDNNGVDRWTTEIVAMEMTFLGGNESSMGQQGGQSPQANAQAPQANPNSYASPAPSGGGMDDFDDDIPFMRLDGMAY
jgi:single-strand DNA-binding protein